LYKKRTLFLGILIVAVVIAIIFAASIVLKNEMPIGTVSTEIVEVREYKGKGPPSASLGPQDIDVEDYRLTVRGLVESELNLTYNEILSNYQHIEKVVTIYSVDGWNETVTWKGISIKDLLEDAEINPEVTNVTFYAYDDFSTFLSLKYIFDNNITLGYKINGVTLPPENGFPFQLVAETEFGYNWVRWIISIELSD
jgi:DMSO/TMAO reductase YedYZ molybdopterin-dependent catalytic subunit